MDHLGAMRVFVAVVETQGFSAAARALGMTLPTTCRKIADLETHLGTQLFNRSTRKVSVTDTGHSYYEDVVKVLEQLDEAERLAGGEYQHVRGLLTLTVPSLFGRLHVLPLVNQFMQQNADVEVRLLFTNHVMDLPEGQINLGLRIGAISDSALTVLQTGTVRQVVCASPDYLRVHGFPRVPEDLHEQRCITFSRSGTRDPWVFKSGKGKQLPIDIKARLQLNAAEAAVDAALDHGGLTQLYAYQAAPHVQSGDLKIVLQDFEVEPSPVNLVFPTSQRIPQKVNAFVEFAKPRIESRLAEISTMCQ